MKATDARPLDETTPDRIRRICVKSLVRRESDHPVWKGIGLFVLVLGILVIGSIAIYLVTDLMQVYRDRIGVP